MYCYIINKNIITLNINIIHFLVSKIDIKKLYVIDSLNS